MWVVFTGEMIYKLWIECSRLNNPSWDYYAPNRHGFGPTAAIRQTSALSVLHLFSSFPKPPTCCVLFYFANSCFSFLYATTSSTKRQRGSRYDGQTGRTIWSGGVRCGVFVDGKATTYSWRSTKIGNEDSKKRKISVIGNYQQTEHRIKVRAFDLRFLIISKL